MKMKILIACLVVLPTLIAVLLFTIAGASYTDPAGLSAAENPAVPVLCIAAGTVATIPLATALWIGAVKLYDSKKKKKAPEEKKTGR